MPAILVLVLILSLIHILALGWATYNGDHMSMYGVNASVPKTLVRHLVRYYADTCGDKALADVLYLSLIHIYASKCLLTNTLFSLITIPIMTLFI